VLPNCLCLSSESFCTIGQEGKERWSSRHGIEDWKEHGGLVDMALRLEGALWSSRHGIEDWKEHGGLVDMALRLEGALWSSRHGIEDWKEIILWLGVSIAWEIVLKGHSIRKAENH
jgi:predicted DNA-binding protein (UPF0278 family)